ncbi:MAG: DSD1 family PLP-dependent enzyme [Burkholderiales bacterium]|nr:MAG: DSD1 family PLP-dependent enzyme [Burkholderiales bacterium]
MTQLADLNTPTALVDIVRMQRNIALMQSRMNSLKVAFRPHVKTTKCLPIAKAQIEAGAHGITVSTLKEAEQFFAAGIADILYAVGMAAPKLRQAAALIQKGCALKIIADSVESASTIARFSSENNIKFEVWIEIDTDGHRSGVQPESDSLIEIGRILASAGALQGVMTHAGGSYALSTPEALQAMAEQERSHCVRAAQRLRDAGLPCPVVSVGSTPTALNAAQLEGVTEVRAGVYVFFDLVMKNVGVCGEEDIALSVLTAVIGHQAEKGWAIVDAGWMAMSRDRGTSSQSQDFGYGQVCDVSGKPMAGYLIDSANQEHGIIARTGSMDTAISKTLPVGTLLRIFPNHACATAAQFPEYQAVLGDEVIETWPRFYGW